MAYYNEHDKSKNNICRCDETKGYYDANRMANTTDPNYSSEECVFAAAEPAKPTSSAESENDHKVGK